MIAFDLDFWSWSVCRYFIYIYMATCDRTLFVWDGLHLRWVKVRDLKRHRSDVADVCIYIIMTVRWQFVSLLRINKSWFSLRATISEVMYFLSLSLVFLPFLSLLNAILVINQSFLLMNTPILQLAFLSLTFSSCYDFINDHASRYFLSLSLVSLPFLFFLNTFLVFVQSFLYFFFCWLWRKIGKEMNTKFWRAYLFCILD